MESRSDRAGSSGDLFEREVARRSGALATVLRLLRQHGDFDLSAPVALMSGEAADSVEAVPVSSLAVRLPCSSALIHPLMERFRVLSERVGFDAAFEEMTADTPEGEEFCLVYDECCAQGGKVRWTYDDLVAVSSALQREMVKAKPDLVVVWDRQDGRVMWGVVHMGF